MPPPFRLPSWLTRLRSTILDHDARHENGGLDEIDLTGLSGEPADVVAKSLFDAGTILAAIADNTPLAKTYAQILALLSGQAAAAFSWNGQNLTGTGTIRAASGLWYREHHFSGSSVAPGLSGATHVDPSANGPGGWGLDLAGETVAFQGHVEADWDAASDLAAEVYFQYDDANEVGDGGLVTDELVLDLNIFYMKGGDTAIKTQALTDTVVIGQSPQYKMFEAEFVIPYDTGGQELAAEDVIGMLLNLDVGNSTVTGGAAKIIANLMEFKYKTAWVGYEV